VLHRLADLSADRGQRAGPVLDQPHPGLPLSRVNLQ
jgi:hypothetical protein